MIKPEQSKNGPYAKISIATNEQWKDKNTGVKQEKTIWHNIYGYGKLGEIMLEFAKVGSLAYVEGRITQNKYKSEDGTEKMSTGIIATEFKFINPNKSTEENTSAKPENSGNVKSTSNFLDDEIPW